jgi:hypothetical protein
MTSRRKDDLHIAVPSSNIHYMPYTASEQGVATSTDGQRAPAGIAPIVPLIALAGQVALPYDLAVNDDGGLDFAWRPSQTREDTLADPLVRATIRRRSSPDGADWIVGSCVEVAGDDGDRTQWCEERNAALREVAGGSPAEGAGGGPPAGRGPR